MLILLLAVGFFSSSLGADFYFKKSGIGNIVIENQESPFQEHQLPDYADSEQNSIDNNDFFEQVAFDFHNHSLVSFFIETAYSLLPGVDRTPFSPPELFV